MIHTLQRWPLVITSLIEAFTPSTTVVLTEKHGELVLCLPNGDVPLPYQESVLLFLSQPSARRDFSPHGLDNYPYFIVDTRRSVVYLATKEEARIHISKVEERDEFDYRGIERFRLPVQIMMRNWINAQMEYMPLDDDETVTVYQLRKQVI